jgi:ATP-dependent Clp protease ATP-binding subunit ClpA
MLKPAITKGSLKVVASTTWEEFYESFEKDRALMRRFHRVAVDEPTAETTEQILIGLSPRLETFHNVMIDTEAMTAAVELSGRYIHDRKNPDKSIDLLDGACARERVKDQGNVTVTKEMIMAQLSKVANIPLDRLQNERSAKIVDLESNIKQKLSMRVITIHHTQQCLLGSEEFCLRSEIQLKSLVVVKMISR